jgi:hypothetical protein
MDDEVGKLGGRVTIAVEGRQPVGILTKSDSMDLIAGQVR